MAQTPVKTKKKPAAKPVPANKLFQDQSATTLAEDKANKKKK